MSGKKDLTLQDRRAFLKLPIVERRKIMAVQAEELLAAGYPFCEECEGDGVVSFHDCGDDTCCCADKSDNVFITCPMCEGRKES